MALQAAVDFKASIVESGRVEAPPQRQFQSGVKGVTWDKQKSKWKVRVTRNKKRLTHYVKPIDASTAALEKARLDAVEKLAELGGIAIT